MANIMGNVGQGGRNHRPDVSLVQQLLNAAMPPGKIRLVTDGLFGAKTLAALADFQRRSGLRPNGLVAPGDSTWQKLSQGPGAFQALHPQVPPAAPPVSAWPAKFTFEQFWNFTEPLEGGFAADCMFMVQDLQVATGMGITFKGKGDRNGGLAMAVALEWVFKPEHPKANQKCDPSDIARDYDVVLGMEELGRQGPGHLAEWKRVTNCRITKDGLRDGVRNRVIFNINFIKTQRKIGPPIGNFDTFPADAQLCVVSLTWAIGNEFGFPKFCAACRKADWFEAANECTLSNKEGTLPRRSREQQLMMHNAGCTALGLGDPDKLHFPGRLNRPSAPSDGRQGFREPHQISMG